LKSTRNSGDDCRNGELSFNKHAFRSDNRNVDSGMELDVCQKFLSISSNRSGNRSRVRHSCWKASGFGIGFVMSWGKNRGRPPQRRRQPQWGQTQKKQKPLLSRNKKFTGILLLSCLGLMLGVHLFMWQLHDKTCAVSCGDPGLGCTVPGGYLSIAFGPCHGYYDVKTNQTVQVPTFIGNG
jgi:hypothetical protein